MCRQVLLLRVVLAETGFSIVLILGPNAGDTIPESILALEYSATSHARHMHVSSFPFHLF